ncbi:MAG TPA: GNAT family N-acetyltransferase [Actinomycetota bacterium]
MTSVRTFPSEEMTPEEERVLRGLFALAWGSEDFSETDWGNALGGLHFVAEDERGILAHASVVPRELEVDGRRLRTGYVEAMATRPDLQGRGIGTKVLRAVNEHIGEAYELGALDTGSDWFYRRLGWVRWRGPTFVRTADAVLRTEDEDGNIMVLPTPASGPLDLDAPISCDSRPGEVW